MKILGIETSADETSAAVVIDGTTILSNVVASSGEIQKKYGGIVPEQAAREQIRCIIPVINEALEKAAVLEREEKAENESNKELFQKKIGREYLFKQIDAIAVTNGPGLIGSLLVGVETAKTFAYITKKPIIPINHHLGHVYASWLPMDERLTTPSATQDRLRALRAGKDQQPDMPAICLIVSGGHTLLLLMKGHGQWKILGRTRDDAAGEAFDKTARLLGFSYPGGPEIEKAAKSSLERGGESRFTFPRPMIDSENYDFSFSGLKTAVVREVKKLNLQLTIYNSQLISDLAASIQEAIVDVLVAKTIRATQEYKVKTVIIGGGVAANSRLKEKFKTASFIPSGVEGQPLSLHIPPPTLCTDNAAVIASAAFFNNHPVPWKEVTANPSLEFPVSV